MFFPDAGGGGAMAEVRGSDQPCKASLGHTRCGSICGTTEKGNYIHQTYPTLTLSYRNSVSFWCSG